MTKKAPKKSQTKITSKKKGREKGGWFQKIPKEIIFSPGGAILIVLALIIEVVDWIPIPGVDSLTWELALEIIFLIFLSIIAKVSFKSMVIPLIIERIPVISDVLPTWIIRMFI